MSDSTLDLPFIAVIPYKVQIHPTLSDSCKLYFGQIVQFAKKSGYMWATDEQLAEMKGCSKRSIERWNSELEEAGFIRRETQNFPVKVDGKPFSWIKKRKIYFNDAFSPAIPAQSSKPKDPEPSLFSQFNPKDFQPSGTAENGGILGTAENGGILGTAENGGININSLDKILKRQCDAPTAVVVFSSLSKLELEPKLIVKISKEYSQAEVDIAVERCLRWKSRPSDDVGIMTTLSRADSWSDNPTAEEKEETNISYLKSLNHLDGKTLGYTCITIGNKYIEFVSGMKVTTFSIDQPDFKMNIVAYLEYLNRVNETVGNDI